MVGLFGYMKVVETQHVRQSLCKQMWQHILSYIRSARWCRQPPANLQLAVLVTLQPCLQ